MAEQFRDAACEQDKSKLPGSIGKYTPPSFAGAKVDNFRVNMKGYQLSDGSLGVLSSEFAPKLPKYLCPLQSNSLSTFRDGDLRRLEAQMREQLAIICNLEYTMQAIILIRTRMNPLTSIFRVPYIKFLKVLLI